MNFTSSICHYIKYKETLKNFKYKVSKKKLEEDRGKGVSKGSKNEPQPGGLGLKGRTEAASILETCSHRAKGV